MYLIRTKDVIFFSVSEKVLELMEQYSFNQNTTQHLNNKRISSLILLKHIIICMNKGKIYERS
jgi:hypothetical protein